MKFEGGEEQPCRYLGKDHAGREKSQCKGPRWKRVPAGFEEQQGGPGWLQEDEVRER